MGGVKHLSVIGWRVGCTQGGVPASPSLRLRLAEAELTEAMTAGRIMTVDEAVALALGSLP